MLACKDCPDYRRDNPLGYPAGAIQEKIRNHLFLVMSNPKKVDLTELSRVSKIEAQLESKVSCLLYKAMTWYEVRFRSGQSSESYAPRRSFANRLTYADR